MKEGHGERVMRKAELFATIGLSDATIWRLEKVGKFPKRLKLGGNSVGWLASDVRHWLQARADERYNGLEGQQNGEH